MQPTICGRACRFLHLQSTIAELMVRRIYDFVLDWAFGRKKETVLVITLTWCVFLLVFCGEQWLLAYPSEQIESEKEHRG